MLAQRFGLPTLRGARGFVAAMFIDFLGTGLFVPFSLLWRAVRIREHVPSGKETGAAGRLGVEAGCAQSSSCDKNAEYPYGYAHR